MTTTLVIGSKTYSSWSLRPWLFLKHHGVPFEEKKILFSDADYQQQIRAVSGSGKVPLLIDGSTKVWESLAICEHVAEHHALRDVWPADPGARALARSMACEMHAGFADLRRDFLFHCRRQPSPAPHSAQTAADVRRICSLWREARRCGDNGTWLFGK